MLHIVPQIPSLVIASIPWLFVQSGVLRDELVLIVHRSLKLPTTDEMYEPVITFLKKNPHSIQFGPKVLRCDDMHGGRAEMTIYRLEVP